MCLTTLTAAQRLTISPPLRLRQGGHRVTSPHPPEGHLVAGQPSLGLGLRHRQAAEPDLRLGSIRRGLGLADTAPIAAVFGLRQRSSCSLETRLRAAQYAYDSDDEAGTAASNAQETPSVANDDDDEADGDSEHAVSASKGKHKKKKKKNKAKTNSAVDSANTADVPADQRRQGSSLQL